MSIIEVRNLSKSYFIAKREEGMWGAVRSLFHREYVEKVAVEDVSFSIDAGEMVGYIGPNGAGKTTLLRTIS
ncbi:MAG: ABC-type uncharacterized transport system, ATPase component, partial [Peptococcaceae bacterium]|nr:ABC-type uncharacterized transport system, ATPase component [Peptococcaceae bacterium]